MPQEKRPEKEAIRLRQHSEAREAVPVHAPLAAIPPLPEARSGKRLATKVLLPQTPAVRKTRITTEKNNS